MNKELYELSYTLKKELHRKLRVVVVTLLSIFIIINIILSFLIFPVRQISVSMESGISGNSCIMFSPLKKNLERGAVVLVRPRNGGQKRFLSGLADVFVSFITAQQFSLCNTEHLVGSEYQIRRIIGIPGDRLYMRDYVMYIKPSGAEHFLTEFELVEKGYNISVQTNPAGWDNSLGVIGSFDEITLGDDEYFVLGDFRNSCVDSRLWGTVCREDVRGGAVVQYFPLNKMNLF